MAAKWYNFLDTNFKDNSLNSLRKISDQFLNVSKKLAKILAHNSHLIILIDENQC